MSFLELIEIKQITAVNGSWYRIGGSRNAPTFERVVLWAIVRVAERDDDTGEIGSVSEVLAGIPAADIGVFGLDPEDWLKNSAGYLELSDEEIGAVAENPLRLAHEKLVWGN